MVRGSARGLGGRLRAALAAAGAEGFDVVLDAVLGPYMRPGWDLVARGGRYVVYGAASMTPAGDRPNWARLAWQYLTRPRVDPLALPGQNRGIVGFNLIWMFDRAGELGELVDRLLALGVGPPSVGHVFPFEEAPAALRLLQGGGTRGKVVLRVGGGGGPGRG